MQEELSIINRIYELYKLIIDINNHLEKRWRHSVGLSLENTVLDCMAELVMAKNAPKPLKAPYLLRAGSHIEIATLKFRLFLELNIANETKIFQGQSLLAEIGRMTNGWLKHTSST